MNLQKYFPNQIAYLRFIFFVLFFLPFHTVLAFNLTDATDILSDAGGAAGYDPNQTSIDPFISTIVKIALSFLGVIFLVLIVYGGFLWMTAKGNEEQVTKAKNLITAAIIGLIIIVAAYAISVFIVGKFSEDFLVS